MSDGINLRLGPRDLNTFHHAKPGQRVRVRVAGRQPAALCPTCAHPSFDTKGTGSRDVSDVVSTLVITLTICVRRFVCTNEGCPQRTFDERFEGINRGGASERAVRFFADLSRGRATPAAARNLGVLPITFAWRWVRPAAPVAWADTWLSTSAPSETFPLAPTFVLKCSFRCRASRGGKPRSRRTVVLPLGSRPLEGTESPSRRTMNKYGNLYQWGGIVVPTSGRPLWASDLARDVEVRSSGDGGYTLDAYGGVHAWGAAPAVTISAYWNGDDRARSLTLNTAGDGGWVIDRYGGLHPFTVS